MVSAFLSCCTANNSVVGNSLHLSSRPMATDFIQAPTSHCLEGPMWCLTLCSTCSPELLILFSTVLLHCLFVYFLQGKFIRINFDVAGYIVGANIETCILIPGLKVFSSSAVKLHYSPRLPTRILRLSFFFVALLVVLDFIYACSRESS